MCIIILKALASPSQMFEVLENFAQANFCSFYFANFWIAFFQTWQNTQGAISTGDTRIYVYPYMYMSVNWQNIHGSLLSHELADLSKKIFY